MSVRAHPCFVCGAERFETLFAGTIAEADRDAAEYFGAARSLTGYFPIVRCRECALVQQNPCDDAEGLARAYAAMPPKADEAHARAATSTAGAELAFVQRFAGSRGRLLDVGAGNGEFLSLAAQAGFDAVGLEPGAEGAALAGRRAPNARVVVTGLMEADLAPHSFEIVTAWDVFEHLIDPRSAVARISEWLAPGGHFLLQVPNGASLTARILGRRWPLLLREHLSYFDGQSLRRLLEPAGFRVLDIRPAVRHFSLAHLMGRLGQLGMPAGRLTSALGSVTLAGPVGELRLAAVRAT